MPLASKAEIEHAATRLRCDFEHRYPGERFSCGEIMALSSLGHFHFAAAEAPAGRHGEFSAALQLLEQRYQLAL